MSRTKRIYNSKHWKWHSEGHIVWYPDWSTAEMEYTGEVDYIGDMEIKVFKWINYDWYPSTSVFPYHPYHQLYMGCCSHCGIARVRERRTRRRRIKLEEREYEKNWREEI